MGELEKYSNYLEDVFISASSGFLHFPPRDMNELLSIIFTAQENLKRLQPSCRQLERRNKALEVSGLLEEPSHSAPPLERAKHHHTSAASLPPSRAALKE